MGTAPVDAHLRHVPSGWHSAGAGRAEGGAGRLTAYCTCAQAQQGAGCTRGQRKARRACVLQGAVALRPSKAARRRRPNSMQNAARRRPHLCIRCSSKCAGRPSGRPQTCSAARSTAAQRGRVRGRGWGRARRPGPAANRHAAKCASGCPAPCVPDRRPMAYIYFAPSTVPFHPKSYPRPVRTLPAASKP